MQKRKAIFIFFMVIVFQSILLSQFHVIPMVEMMFTYEAGVQCFIDKVSLVGQNNTYSVEILGPEGGEPAGVRSPESRYQVDKIVEYAKMKSCHDHCG